MGHKAFIRQTLFKNTGELMKSLLLLALISMAAFGNAKAQNQITLQSGDSFTVPPGRLSTTVYCERNVSCAIA